jgi:hypothetical protein
LSEPAHPLAEELAAQLLRRPPASRRTLVVGLGSGRNLKPLFAVKAKLTIIDEDPGRASAFIARLGAAEAADFEPATGTYRDLERLGCGFDGALSTHAFLHGTREAVSAALAVLAASLAPGAPCFLTLGTTADPRYGDGTRVDAGSWAPSVGPEAGVPHAYFDREQARAALAPFGSFEIAEGSGSAGIWAHDPLEAQRIVHWFVRAVARDVA